MSNDHKFFFFDFLKEKNEAVGERKNKFNGRLSNFVWCKKKGWKQ